ncbi:MAG: LysR family transcriptional regulator [Tagaea sp.]|nr:LysR family transcriptional regulator [Tagaea sp.]
MVSGGVGSAAQTLGSSQPSISRALAKLERDLGFRLFDRVRGRLVPTREGQLLHAEVRAGLAGLERLKRSAARIREVGGGSICVASLSALGHGLVPRAIAAFSERFPKVRVNLQVRTSNAVRDLVASGQADIGIAADEVDTTGVEYSVFATPPAVCVMAEDHPLARRKTIRPADLSGERLVTLSPDDTVRRTLDEVFTREGIVPNIAIETPYSLSIAILASLGAGVGIANAAVVSDAMVQGIAVRRFEPAIYFRALLLRPPGAANSVLVSAMTRELFRVRNELGIGKLPLERK